MSTAEADVGTEKASAVAPRVESIDLLRGLVMVLMVLDHCRDFFGDPRNEPTDLATTTPALFLTRWVTHFCAPTFSLLAGVGAALWGTRHPRGALSRYLVTRGLVLILLEQTWVNVFIFNVPHFFVGLVLWSLGWSMIVLAVLVHLPRPVVAVLAVTAIAGHNLLDGYTPPEGVATLLWGFLHAPGLRILPGGLPILMGYPLIPWAAVMALGYVLGPVFTWDAPIRRSTLMGLGLGLVAGFFALRWSNVYGDPQRWSIQRDSAFTAISFLNATKQPPSLLYLLMTLGPALLALAWLDRGLGPIGAPLRLIGRTPLFFFLLQWPVIHGLAIATAAARGYPIGWMFRFPPFESPPGYGDSLPLVYASWVVTTVVLYMMSRWYDGWRRGTRVRQVRL